MKHRKKLIGALVVAIAVAAIAWTLTEDKPVNRIVLKDKSVLSLLQVTYGTNHTLVNESRMFARLRDACPTNWQANLGPARRYPKTTAEDELVCWVKRTYRSGVSLQPNFDRFRVLDDHGCVFAEEFIRDKRVFPQHTVAIEIKSFPRRQKSFKLELLSHDGLRESFEVPNPVWKEYPTWEPSSLPITQTNEGRIFALKSVSVSSNASGWRAVADFALPDNWRANAEYVEDATGNRLNLCPMESAWNLHGRFWPTPEAGFEPKQSCVISNVPILPEGVFAVLGASNRLGEISIQLKGEAGMGQTTYSNGIPVAAKPEPAEAIRKYARVDVDSKTSIYWSLAVSGSAPKFSLSKPHVALRISGLKKDEYLSVRTIDAEKGIVDSEHLFSYPGLEIYSLPVGVTNVTLQFIVQKQVEMDFCFKPPGNPGAKH